MSNKNVKNGLLAFFAGLFLLGAGLYMLSNKIMISSGFSSVYIGGFRIPFGLTTVPLIIGIIWLVVQPDKIIPKIMIVLGAIFIISAIIMSVHFYFAGTTLYEYVLIFGMIAVGSGLLLKTLFS